MAEEFRVKARILFDNLLEDSKKAVSTLESTVGKWFSNVGKGTAVGGGAGGVGAGTGNGGGGGMFGNIAKMGIGIWGIKQGVDIMAGTLNKMAQYSPLMAGSMEALKKAFELIMVPIADIFGLFLRPLAITLLRILLPVYSEWITFRSTFKNLFDDYIGEGNNKIVALLKAIWGAIKESPAGAAFGAGGLTMGAGLGMLAGGKAVGALGGLFKLSGLIIASGILLKLGIIVAAVGAIIMLGTMIAKTFGGSKQVGGHIGETGLYKLHSGETVLPKGSHESGLIFNPTYNITVSGDTDEGKIRRIIERVNADQFDELRRRTRY